MEPLKELFNEAYCQRLNAALKQEMSSLKIKHFRHALLNGLADMELNERLRHIASIMAQFLPTDFTKALKITDKLIFKMDRGYTSLIFPHFVANHGKEHFDLSMSALKNYTSFGSSEFAVREFFKLDFEKALNYMETWSKDNQDHVRRLASEGSRPRLPWSFKLDKIVAQPELTKNIINNLRQDNSLYVRKSVANHLNDISKDHPDYFTNFVKRWDRTNDHTAWIVKHASRSLIKQGNKEALALFQVEEAKGIHIVQFAVKKKTINLGENLEFHLLLKSTSKQSQNIILDYIIHYVKQDRKLYPKVFKWTSFEMKTKQEYLFNKKQLIKDFTTRKHYAGKHKIEIQLNGKILAETYFTLKV